MSYQKSADDLSGKVKLALERRGELAKKCRDVQGELRVSKAENEHLLDMIMKAYPELSEDVSSCSSSDGSLSDNGDGCPPDGPGRSNGKRAPADSPARLVKRRRRQQGKRDDRSDPKHIEPLQRDAEGRIVFPIVVGRGQDRIEVHDLGRVVWDPETYHTSRYLWPPGFRSTRICPSLKTGDPSCVYTSEILDGNGDMPVFQVTAEDMPDQPFRASSSSGVWRQILDALTAKGISVKTHVSGPQMYGLSNLGVTKAIQELDNAEKCTKYIQQRWVEPDAKSESKGTADEDGNDDGDDDDGDSDSDDDKPAAAGN
ncbi:hypothetical protein LPJ61_000549 [Coemansia biformis]|uniref:FYR N-terminal domain-containing protein n=1 Tax=Coemansia biformis TaxID=1286918 RepID=A0A9W7YG11_9FUNG|nr:hypothetical protein LPJ61_000549 [Coemansia biformis]